MTDRKFHKRFKKLDIFNLFTPMKYKTGSIYGFKYCEYAIDFGTDTEGAARILSKVLHDVYDVAYHDTELEFITLHGRGEELDKSRKQNKPWYERYIWWIGLGAGLLIWILINLYDS